MNQASEAVELNHCPHCDKKLTYQQIRMLVAGLTPEERSSLRGSISAEMRKRVGTGGGRKLSDQPRCPCGAMTAKRAKARGHRCEYKSVKDLRADVKRKLKEPKKKKGTPKQK